MKTWQPVTCECKVAETYIGDTPVAMAGVLNKCAFHAAIPDDQLYGEILADGRVFCGTLRHALNNFQGVLSEFKTKENGDQYLDFKAGIGWHTAWTGIAPNRVLHITVAGVALPSPAKQALQNRFNLDHGLGKVVIEN